jgi:signal transduction histidine kinase
MTIRVEDDGSGCDEQHLNVSTGRGVRLDEAVGGHGLGLAIAGEIVAVYGGTLDLGRSATLGGFRAVVTLPRA